MTTSITQEVLDYSNDAQYRIAASLRNLRKRTTIDVQIGTSEYALPDDVIDLRGVYDGQTLIQPIVLDQVMEMLSGTASVEAGIVCYTVEPGTLGFIPTPTEAFTATIYYTARPAQLDSAADFELSGDAETLMEHVVLGDRLDDDRQPELAANERNYVDTEAQRLKRLRLPEAPGRIPVSAYSQSNQP